MFFLDDGLSDVVALAAGSCGFADVAGFLVYLEDFFCGYCPVVGLRFWGLALEVAFPVVVCDLFPGYLQGDLQDVTKLFDADGVVSVHGLPFWLA